MTRRSRTTLLAVLAALALGFPGLGCNRVGDDPTIGEAIILVTATSAAGTSAAAITEDVVATVEFTVADRNGGSSPVFNSVRFTSFTVVWAGGLFAPSGGIPDSVSFAMGSTGNTMLIDLIPAGAKPPAGTVDFAVMHFDGEDLIGRKVEFDVSVGIAIVP